MSAMDTELMARMSDWIEEKAESRKSADARKRDAWELWKRRAACDERTLREILDGPRALNWSPEREQEERNLFEEFWAGQAR
jgi:hypothetical protein